VSAWLERLHALVPATHAGADSSDRSDSAPNGANGPIGIGIAVGNEVSEPPFHATADSSDSTPEPEPMAWAVPVEGEGLPCGPCRVCGGLSFWRRIASDAWRCIVCAERRSEYGTDGKTGEWCSLPPSCRMRVLTNATSER
jgi:hypothetical protein